jgi:hypothetical protein
MSPTSRAFDTGDRVTVRYAPTAQVRTVTRTRTVARSASVPGGAPLPAGLTSFSAYVREMVATGASVAAYTVEAFCTDTTPPTLMPTLEPSAEKAGGAAAPPPQDLMPAPVVATPTAATPAESAAPPATPEERLRAQWAFEEQIATARSLVDATDEERQAVNAIRCASGQTPLAPAPVALEPPPAAPQVSPSPPAPAESMSVADGHARFDRLMAADLAYATTFDAGNVTLSRRFHEMDAMLDREESRAHERTLSRAAHAEQPQVEDKALLDDLAALCRRLSSEAVPPETGTAPTETPTASPTAAPTEAPAPAPTAGSPPAPAPVSGAVHMENDHVETTT